jgi:AraC-like DNA-binding protein
MSTGSWFTGTVDLGTRIARLARRPSHPAWLDGMTAFTTERTTEPLGTVTEPCFALVVQGAKRMVLGDRVFDYHAGQYLVVTVDLPVTAQITRASGQEPFLAFGLPLKAAVIAQLLLERGGTPSRSEPGSGIVMSDASQDLIDAVDRLLDLVDHPEDFRILSDGVVREIHWRLMTGPQAATVRQIGLADSRLSVVANAIRRIQAHFDRVIRVDDLAREVGLSTASLNRYFRAVTAMSPLQYQKRIRLQKARLQLITTPNDVAAIGYAVGYESPSQFSREYRRLFGAPPREDAERMQNISTFGI